MAIGIKLQGPTQLSGTTDKQLGGASFDIPSEAKCILGVIPILTSPAGNTAGEPIAASLNLKSDDFGITPFKVLAQPIGSSLLKSVFAGQGPLDAVMYPINVKDTPERKVGGSKLDLYGTGLFDHTIEPYMSAAIIFADFIPKDPITKRILPQRFSKIGTFTNTGTAAAEVSGSNITITGGKRIVEVGGFVVGTTVAALKGIMGSIRLSSDGFKPSWDPVYPLNPICGQVDTNIGEAVAGVARWKIDLGIKRHLVINDFFTLDVALTTTGNWIAQIIYI